MPSFFNPRRNYVITTSLKVMFSTLSQQPSLRPLRHDLRAAIALWWKPGMRRYFLARDPYDRLVSFYADKFFSTPADTGLAQWQHCQVVFFAPLGLSGRESTAIIAERLRAVTFEHFVRLLPQVFRRDEHLWPQCWNVPFRIGALCVPAPLHRVLKMESDRQVLAEELGLDLSIRANATTHASRERYFAPRSYAIAQEVYRGDFERFDYPLAPERTQEAPS